MMERLTRRVEALAAAEQRRQVQMLAGRMKEMISGASVEVFEARVIVAGRGLLKRWLIDPALRFLSTGFK